MTSWPGTKGYSLFEKSLSINRDMKSGDIITFNDLEAKKPLGYGVPAKDYKKIIGKTLTRDMKKWDFLKEKYTSD